MFERPTCLRAALLAATLLGAAACVPPLDEYRPRAPRDELPRTWAGREGQELVVDSNEALGGLSELFDDPYLATLIDEALAGNQELSLRFQELLVARAAFKARTGAYLPRLDAGLGAGLEKVGDGTSQGVTDAANGVPEDLPEFRLGLRASWEVDIWHRLRDSAKAASLRYFATVEGRHFLVTELVGEIAEAYYELLALDRQLEVLASNIQLQQDALEIVRLEKRAAKVTELAVQRFEAEVLKNQSELFDVEQRIVATENRLNFLVGRYPRPIERDAARFDRALPPTLRVGVPADLLENRPDILRASLTLEAAELEVGVARKEFYPSLEVEGSLGYEATELDRLLITPESVFYSIGAGLAGPVFNRRVLTGEYLAANAEQTSAVIEYERTVLAAFNEVSTLLARIENLERSVDLETRQVELLDRASESSATLFQSARADYVEVLQTRRESLEAQRELIDSRLELRHAAIGLYRALGGGWRESTPEQDEPRS